MTRPKEPREQINKGIVPGRGQAPTTPPRPAPVPTTQNGQSSSQNSQSR